MEFVTNISRSWAENEKSSPDSRTLRLAQRVVPRYADYMETEAIPKRIERLLDLAAEAGPGRDRVRRSSLWRCHRSLSPIT